MLPDPGSVERRKPMVSDPPGYNVIWCTEGRRDASNMSATGHLREASEKYTMNSNARKKQCWERHSAGSHESMRCGKKREAPPDVVDVGRPGLKQRLIKMRGTLPDYADLRREVGLSSRRELRGLRRCGVLC